MQSLDYLVKNLIYPVPNPDFPFLDNIHCHHGKKYEPIATMIYEHIYNNKVTEFGCLPSSKYPILAASPDGICSKSTLDGKFSDRLGTMLEIKCPVTRYIYTKGKISGEYYDGTWIDVGTPERLKFIQTYLRGTKNINLI